MQLYGPRVPVSIFISALYWPDVGISVLSMTGSIRLNWDPYNYILTNETHVSTVGSWFAAKVESEPTSQFEHNRTCSTVCSWLYFSVQPYFACDMTGATYSECKRNHIPLENDKEWRSMDGLDEGVGNPSVAFGGCTTLWRPYGRRRRPRLSVVDPDERPVLVELGRIGIVVIAETVNWVGVQRFLVAVQGLAASTQFRRRPQRWISVR